MTKALRKSPQRDLILQVLKEGDGHLPVDLIFAKARKKMPKISLGTVYRNLGTLVEAKAVTSMLGPNNVTFYELFSAPHHHFICETCDVIQNLDSPGVNMCVKCIEDKDGPKVNSVLTTIYGVCSECS